MRCMENPIGFPVNGPYACCVEFQTHPPFLGVFSSYRSSSIHMQAHGSPAPNKGISWQQTNGKLLNPCAKLLSDVSMLPDCVRNGPFLVQLQLLSPKVCSLETHYYGRKCQNTRGS